jgi:hypothetical protein
MGGEERRGCGQEESPYKPASWHDRPRMTGIVLSEFYTTAGWRSLPLRPDSIPRWSVLDAALGQDAFLVGVFDFAHFGYGVGDFDQ